MPLVLACQIIPVGDLIELFLCFHKAQIVFTQIPVAYYSIIDTVPVNVGRGHIFLYSIRISDIKLPVIVFGIIGSV